MQAVKGSFSGKEVGGTPCGRYVRHDRAFPQLTWCWEPLGNRGKMGEGGHQELQSLEGLEGKKPTKKSPTLQL